jgi:RNA binding exosome subunit
MDALADSMFKLGEYYADEARDIADFLKDAGMKVDIRTFTSSNIEVIHYLEGRMSEIKSEITEERFNRYARFLDAFKKVLAKGATSENFHEMLHLELDPEIDEKRKLFARIMEGSTSKEEREAEYGDTSNIFGDLLEVTDAESFCSRVLERNDIQIGDSIGGKLDDPIIRIFADENDDDKSKFARTTTSFSVDPCAAIFVDEFSTVFSENLDKEFKDEYEEEYSRLFFLGKLISELAEPYSVKIDMKLFSERCELQMENNGNLLKINGRRAAEELARSLEKNDIIKIKGDGIKWKR